jgi:TetR/AcrR family transcriptional regulator, cholesterol catabolism regulator
MSKMGRPRGDKRPQILAVAAEHFGRDGYEDTRWADIADAVGVGPTGLYHYFESKQHCLYEIMAETVASLRHRFETNVSAHDDFVEAAVAVFVDGFDLTDQEIFRNRVLSAEHGLAAVHRKAPREEEARIVAGTEMRDLEFAWGTFLARGMQQGPFPQKDPRLLTYSLLGLYQSIWHWYMPGGALTLKQLAEFFVEQQVAMLGLPTDSAQERLAGLRPGYRGLTAAWPG